VINPRHELISDGSVHVPVSIQEKNLFATMSEYEILLCPGHNIILMAHMRGMKLKLESNTDMARNRDEWNGFVTAYDKRCVAQPKTIFRYLTAETSIQK